MQHWESWAKPSTLLTQELIFHYWVFVVLCLVCLLQAAGGGLQPWAWHSPVAQCPCMQGTGNQQLCSSAHPADPSSPSPRSSTLQFILL